MKELFKSEQHTVELEGEWKLVSHCGQCSKNTSTSAGQPEAAVQSAVRSLATARTLVAGPRRALRAGATERSWPVAAAASGLASSPPRVPV